MIVWPSFKLSYLEDNGSIQRTTGTQLQESESVGVSQRKVENCAHLHLSDCDWFTTFPGHWKHLRSENCTSQTLLSFRARSLEQRLFSACIVGLISRIRVKATLQHFSLFSWCFLVPFTFGNEWRKQTEPKSKPDPTSPTVPPTYTRCSLSKTLKQPTLRDCKIHCVFFWQVLSSPT